MAAEAAWRTRVEHDARRHRQDGDRVRAARPRRRRLPDRHQVEDRSRYGGRPQIHRLQRRRGRQRHLRRPHDHGGRSLRADRGHGDRRHRHRRDQGLRLHPLGISARDRRRCARRSRSPAGPACSASRVLGSPNAFDMEVRVGAGAYVCGEETVAARKPGRQARHGSRQAAAAGASRACSAGRRSSTTSSRWPPCRSSSTRARPSTRISAWAARAARSRSRSPAMSSMAACSRRPSA